MTQPVGGWDPAPPRAAVAACCSDLYGNPLAELLIGDSMHPGGLASTRRLLHAARLVPGARVLDAGCGLGASARLAAEELGLVVDAVDGSAAAIERAGRRSSTGRVRWHVAELSRLPFDGDTFDAVLAECVLSTTDRVSVLRELARVVRPGGALALSDVEVEDGAVPSLAGHRLLGAALCTTDAWRRAELEERLPEAGFRLERRWDLTGSILELIDRVESRVGLARVAARDLGIDLATLVGGGATAREVAFDADQARELADGVRIAVRQGQLRYFGSIAIRALTR